MIELSWAVCVIQFKLEFKQRIHQHVIKIGNNKVMLFHQNDRYALLRQQCH